MEFLSQRTHSDFGLDGRWFGRAKKDEKSGIFERFLGDENQVVSDVQSDIKSDDQDEIQTHTLCYKITRQFVYFSLYLYATIMSIRLVLVYHKLDEYLQNQEQNRPFLALFQTVQIIPSIFFGYTYDIIHSKTSLSTATFIISTVGVVLAVLVNTAVIHRSMIIAFVLNASLNAFTCGLQAGFGSKFTDKSKNTGLVYGYLSTAYSIASLPVVMNNLEGVDEKLFYYLFSGCFLFPLAVFVQKYKEDRSFELDNKSDL